MNEHELELLEGINVTVNLTRHEQQRLSSEVVSHGRRLTDTENRLRRLDSVAPRAMRAVTESVHEHDTEMAAQAVYMGEMHARLARMEDAQTKNAKAAKASRQSIAATMTFAIPFLVRLLDWILTVKVH